MPNYDCPIFEKTYRDLYKKDIKDSVNDNKDPEEIESVSELPSPVRMSDSPLMKTQLTHEVQSSFENDKKTIDNSKSKQKFDKQSRREKII